VNDDLDLRDRLRLPVGFAVLLMWVAAGVAAIITDDPSVFIITSGPFTILCGYLFGTEILRRATSGEHDR